MVKSPIFGLDTKTYWLTDRQSQCDFDFDYTTEHYTAQINLEQFIIIKGRTIYVEAGKSKASQQSVHTVHNVM
jgi:hypothetical protein